MPTFHEDEKIQYEIAANLRKNIEFVGGTLIITDRRFIFEPHTMNIQKAPVEFALSDITNIDSSNVLGFVPNGIKLEMKDGTTNTFVVEPSYIVKREEIVKTVQELM